jgi:NAD(P)-dependent dehydrogenase (short-subunit alcohol dehydrogenase family)
MDLKGRVALITGATGHMGSAAADALAELGASIVVLDLSQDACVETANRIQETYGVKAFPLAADITKDNPDHSISQQISDRFGRLDILLNCAALVGTSDVKGWGVPFAQQSMDAWSMALDANLTAPFGLVQSCAELLESSGHGSVIYIGSIYGLLGPDMRLYEGTNAGNPAAYAASKGGTIQITRWLATVMAPKVRVNSISPGGLWRGQAERFHKEYVSRTPIGRMAAEEDFKGAISYLASDMSAYVTGHNLVVDGGWTAW